MLETATRRINEKMGTYGEPADNLGRLRDMCHATGRENLSNITCEDLATILLLRGVVNDVYVQDRKNAVAIAGYAHVLDSVRGI